MCCCCFVVDVHIVVVCFVVSLLDVDPFFHLNIIVVLRWAFTLACLLVLCIKLSSPLLQTGVREFGARVDVAC